MSDLSRDRSAFSIVQGGLFYRLERRLSFQRTGLPPLPIRILIAFTITFLPLVALAAAAGVLWGNKVELPLLSDWTVLARFLLAVPLLFTIERGIDRRLSESIGYVVSSGLIPPAETETFEGAIRKLERSRDSLFPELLILIGAFVFGWLSSREILPLQISNWRVITPGVVSSTTPAGHWLNLVSQPIFSFLTFRWLWRMWLWASLIYRISRLHMNVVPTHPDRAAGLGIFGFAQVSFAAFIVPMSITVAARGVEWVKYGGGTVDALKYPLIAFVVIAALITLGPLLVFVPKLFLVKKRGLEEYGVLAFEYTRDFDRKWVRQRGSTDEPLLGAADIQSLADLGNSYAVVRSMRVMPLSRGHLLSVLISALLPMLPFVAMITPIEQILGQLANLVIR